MTVLGGLVGSCSWVRVEILVERKVSPPPFKKRLDHV